MFPPYLVSVCVGGLLSPPKSRGGSDVVAVHLVVFRGEIFSYILRFRIYAHVRVLSSIVFGDVVSFSYGLLGVVPLHLCIRRWGFCVVLWLLFVGLVVLFLLYQLVFGVFVALRL